MERIDYKKLLDFYKGKSVLITGNTGFKGSWLTYVLLSAGAEVTGYAQRPSVRLKRRTFRVLRASYTLKRNSRRGSRPASAVRF